MARIEKITLRGAAFYYFNLVFTHVFGERMALFFFRKKAGKNKQKILSQMQSRVGELVPVDTVTTISLEDFRNNYYKPCIPLVIKGAAKDWDCSKIWTMDFFEKDFGNFDVIMNDNRGLIAKGEEQNFETLKMADYIRHLKTGGKKYLKFSPLFLRSEEKARYFDLNWLQKYRCDSGTRADIQLFIGGKGSSTPIHCAMIANLFIQVRGKKKWLLYPSCFTPAIDPPVARKFYFFSEVDPHNVDRARYPLFPYASGYEVTLDEGDVLWNPPYMWHAVYNLTDTIAVAYKFNYFSGALRSAPIMTLLSLMAVKPTIAEHLFHSTFRKKYIHLTRSQA